jgi:hypothetical protein
MYPTDPAEGGETGSERTVVERPLPGLARGRYPLPAWAVASFGVTVVLSAILYVIFRALRRARPRRGAKP